MIEVEDEEYIKTRNGPRPDPCTILLVIANLCNYLPLLIIDWVQSVKKYIIQFITGRWISNRFNFSTSLMIAMLTSTSRYLTLSNVSSSLATWWWLKTSVAVVMAVDLKVNWSQIVDVSIAGSKLVWTI